MVYTRLSVLSSIPTLVCHYFTSSCKMLISFYIYPQSEKSKRIFHWNFSNCFVDEPRDLLGSSEICFMAMQECFDSRKGFLDWIKIGWIRQKENEMCTYKKSSDKLSFDVCIDMFLLHWFSTSSQISSSWCIEQLSRITMLHFPGYGFNWGAYKW
jgi:hypothetical protein